MPCTASPEAIEAPQAFLTPIWVEKARPRKTVNYVVVRPCSPNTLESTIPADWKARGAHNQRDESDKQEYNYDTRREDPFTGEDRGINTHFDARRRRGGDVSSPHFVGSVVSGSGSAGAIPWLGICLHHQIAQSVPHAFNVHVRWCMVPISRWSCSSAAALSLSGGSICTSLWNISRPLAGYSFQSGSEQIVLLVSACVNGFFHMNAGDLPGTGSAVPNTLRMKHAPQLSQPQ